MSHSTHTKKEGSSDDLLVDAKALSEKISAAVGPAPALTKADIQRSSKLRNGARASTGANHRRAQRQGRARRAVATDGHDGREGQPGASSGRPSQATGGRDEACRGRHVPGAVAELEGGDAARTT